jgi:hypothetical protein
MPQVRAYTAFVNSAVVMSCVLSNAPCNGHAATPPPPHVGGPLCYMMGGWWRHQSR